MDAMDRLSDFEQTVLARLLSGQDPRFAQLRRQAEGLRVLAREETGVGFFVSIAVEAGIPAVEGETDLVIEGVSGELEGLAHGAGFIAFVTDGYLSTIEGYCYDEPWPTRLDKYRLYFDEDQPVLRRRN